MDDQRAQIVQAFINIEWTWADFEHMIIEAAMLRNKGNLTHTATQLGLSVRTVRSKVQKFNLEYLKELRYGKKETSN
jgi:DNA-binding NtrC family response regulator